MWYVFFFKQKTAYEIYQCDWSSDVCSSDLTNTAVWMHYSPPDKYQPIFDAFPLPALTGWGKVLDRKSVV